MNIFYFVLVDLVMIVVAYFGFSFLQWFISTGYDEQEEQEINEKWEKVLNFTTKFHVTKVFNLIAIGFMIYINLDVIQTAISEGENVLEKANLMITATIMALMALNLNQINFFYRNQGE